MRCSRTIRWTLLVVLSTPISTAPAQAGLMDVFIDPTDGQFDANEVTELLRSIINTAFADLLGEAKIAALDLAAS